MDKEKMLRKAEEIRELSIKFDEMEFLEEDAEFFTNVVEMIKKSINEDQRKGTVTADFIKVDGYRSKDYLLDVIENQIKILEESQPKVDVKTRIEISNQINELSKTYLEIKKAIIAL
ncbi:MAG: hypothetical protein KH415_18135 [Clostridium sp.]|nr:hypothetical protein [Clostridium sp.]